MHVLVYLMFMIKNLTSSIGWCMNGMIYTYRGMIYTGDRYMLGPCLVLERDRYFKIYNILKFKTLPMHFTASDEKIKLVKQEEDELGRSTSIPLNEMPYRSGSAIMLNDQQPYRVVIEKKTKVKHNGLSSFRYVEIKRTHSWPDQ
jgi:hypothetical protein